MLYSEEPMAQFSCLNLNIQHHLRGPRRAETSINRYEKGYTGHSWPSAEAAGAQEGKGIQNSKLNWSPLDTANRVCRTTNITLQLVPTHEGTSHCTISVSFVLQKEPRHSAETQLTAYRHLKLG